MARKRHKKARIQDGITVSTSGMGSSCDQSISMQPSSFAQAGNQNSPFFRFGPERDSYFYSMYESYWEAKKGIDIPADDMTREGWELLSETTDKDKLDQVEKLSKALGFRKEIRKALIYRRLFGGSLIYFGIKGKADDKPNEPLNIDSIGKGDLTFIRAIPSHRVSTTSIDTDPLSQNYQRPETYTIGHNEVHRSRFLVFDGNPLDLPTFSLGSSYSKNNNIGFGESILLNLFTEIQNAQGVRQSVSALLHKLSVAIFKVKGVAQKRSSKRGTEVLAELEEIVQTMSNFRAVTLDRDDGIENYSSNADQGANLIMIYLQVLSAAFNFPATRFLGTAPGGLNATGESDLRIYYGRVGADQVNNLEQPLMLGTQIIARSVLGDSIDDLKIEFNPLWQMTEKEDAEIRNLNATAISTLTTVGLLDDDEGRKEISDRKIVLNGLEQRPEPEPFDLNIDNGDDTDGDINASVRP